MSKTRKQRGLFPPGNRMRKAGMTVQEVDNLLLATVTAEAIMPRLIEMRAMIEVAAMGSGLALRDGEGFKPMLPTSGTIGGDPRINPLLKAAT